MGYYTTWTIEEDRELLRLRSNETPWSQCAEILGRKVQATRSHYRVLKSHGLSEPEAVDAFHVLPVDELGAHVSQLLADDEQQDPIHWRKLLSLAGQTQEALEELTPSKDIQEVRVPGDPYPIILFSGDWHLGH